MSALEADEEDADLLRGISKGYKLKADGSKTSYFDRSDKVDAATKALLEAAKAPKKIDVSDPAPSGGGASGGAGGVGAPSAAPSAASAWNAAGTFEEKDVSAWATADLSARFAAVSVDVSGGNLRVTAVDGMEGSASIISNRGKVKRPFELACQLKWQFVDGDPAHVCEGAVAFSEIVPASGAKGFAAEQTFSVTKKPSADLLPGLDDARAALQARLDAAMQGFVEALAAK